MLAGTETVVTVLSSATFFILANPIVLQTVTREVRSAFRTHADINIAAVERLPYMCAVIKEALRLIPAVPLAVPRKIPPGGDLICGRFVPENV